MKAMALIPISILACVSAQAGVLSVDPPVVESGRGSVVTISGHSQFCAPLVSHVQAAVSGSTLNLSAVFENNPAALCQPGPVPFATDFSLPALDSGAYTVLLRLMPACSYSPTPCPFAAPIPDTGRLYAQDPATSHYHIDPKRTEAGGDFRVKLLAPEFLCGSGFDSLTVEMKGHRISLGFQHHPHPEALCPGGGGFGPIFDLSGLSPGTYQVFAAQKTPCDRGLCTMVSAPETFAGSFIADAFSTRPLWVSPRVTRAGTPYALSLGGVGFSCEDSLSDKRAEVKDGAIRLHYTLNRTSRVRTRCMVDTIFVGNEPFTMPALAVGVYPVFLVPENCGFTSPLCASDLATVAVDTVIAQASLGLHPSGGKAGAHGLREGRAARGALPWRGREVDFSGREVDPIIQHR